MLISKKQNVTSWSAITGIIARGKAKGNYYLTVIALQIVAFEFSINNACSKGELALRAPFLSGTHGAY